MTAIADPTKLNFYPISVDLRDKKVLFLGGGRETLHESHKLIEFGAYVDIVSERPIREVAELALTHSHRLTLIKKSSEYISSSSFDISSYTLVFAYSKFNDRNEQLVQLCNSKGVMCASRFSDGDFLVPRTLRRGHLKVSVSTDQISSAMEEVLLSRIEADSLKDLDSFALFLDGIADKIANLPTPIAKEQMLKTCQFLKELSGNRDVARALRRSNFSEAKQQYQNGLETYLETSSAVKSNE